MTITPSDWMSNSLLAVETLQANSAGFRAIMSAADVAAARAKTIWQDERTAMAAPFCLLMLEPGEDDEREALRVVSHTNQIHAYLCWPIDNTGASTEKEKAVLALNAFGLVLADIAALVGTGTYLARAKRSWEPPRRTSDKGPHPNCWDAVITYSWEI